MWHGKYVGNLNTFFLKLLWTERVLKNKNVSKIDPKRNKSKSIYSVEGWGTKDHQFSFVPLLASLPGKVPQSPCFYLIAYRVSLKRITACFSHCRLSESSAVPPSVKNSQCYVILPEGLSVDLRLEVNSYMDPPASPLFYLEIYQY